MSCGIKSPIKGAATDRYFFKTLAFAPPHRHAESKCPALLRIALKRQGTSVTSFATTPSQANRWWELVPSGSQGEDAPMLLDPTTARSCLQLV
jgi:hypothetical protein